MRLVALDANLNCGDFTVMLNEALGGVRRNPKFVLFRSKGSDD